MKANGYAHGSGIGCVALLALTHRVFGLIVHAIVNEAEHPVSGIIRDIRHVTENFFQPYIDEPFVGRFLNFNEVGHIHNLFDFSETHACAASALNGIHFQH